VSPVGRHNEELLVEAEGQRLLCMKRQERLLPADVVNEELAERAEALAQRQGKPITKAEKDALKEEVTEGLMAQAFVRSKNTLLWWDTRRRRIIIDNTSDKVAEEVLNLLRLSIGSLKVVPLSTAVIPIRAMTEWVSDPSSRPSWLELTGNAFFKAKGDDSSYTSKNVDLDSDEARGLMETGRQIQKVSFRHEAYLAGSLNDQLIMSSIKFADRVREEAMAIDDGDNYYARVEADFIIMAAALAAVIDDLIATMGGIGKKQNPSEENEAETSGA
jgi:recombination associated protein RdgC